MRHTAWYAWGGAIAVTLAISSPVAAQNAPDRKWEIEAHVGGSSFTNPTSGRSQLPPAGAVYSIDAALPLSRQVSSWYFGDGTVLFNATRRALPSTVPLTAIDPVLTRAGSQRERGLSLGFRVSRAITDRVSAEFSVEGSLARLRMTDDARAGIEASSVSFERAFDSLIVVSAADSSATIRSEGGGRLSASGALNVNLLAARRVTPYVTIGAGIVSTRGVLPNATLVGRYRILDYLDGTGAVVVDDTDSVNVRMEEDPSPMLLLGGGFTFNVTRRFGIRGDIRFSITPNNLRMVLDAVPSHAGVPMYSIGLIGADASAVFASPGTPRQRSLSGGPITGFETFAGSGYHLQTAITFGYFARF